MARCQINGLTQFRIAMKWLQSGMNRMGDFIQIGESGLKSEFEDWGDWYERQTDGFSDEEKSDFIDGYYEDLAMVRDVAPQMFRKACFIMLIGVWETAAANLVRHLYQFNILGNKPIQKIYCDKAKLYLRDDVGFRKSTFRGAWDFCERAAKVRHIIIHNDGRLPYGAQGKLGNNVETARRFVRYTRHIHLSQHSSIELDREFCYTLNEKVVESVRSLTNEAVRIYRLRMKNTQQNSGSHGTKR